MKKGFVLMIALLMLPVISFGMADLTRRQVYDICQKFVDANRPGAKGDNIIQALKNEGWDAHRVEGGTLKKMDQMTGGRLPLGMDSNNIETVQLVKESLDRSCNLGDGSGGSAKYNVSFGSRKFGNETVYAIGFRDDMNTLDILLAAIAGKIKPVSWPTSPNDYVLPAAFDYLMLCAKDKALGEFVAKMKEDKTNPTVIVTGHEIGGGVAALMAALLAELKKVPSPKNIQLVTFSELVPGYHDFALKHLNSFGRYDNILNTYDPVSIIFALGYRPLPTNLIGISYGDVHDNDHRSGMAPYREYIETVND